MKVYKIFESPYGKGLLYAVKQGWSWPAFVCGLFGFSWIWALTKKLWVFAAILFVPYLISTIGWLISLNAYTYSQLETGTSIALFGGLLSIISMIVAACMGNSLVSDSLIRQQYRFIDSVASTSPEMALFEYKKKMTD